MIYKSKKRTTFHQIVNARQSIQQGFSFFKHEVTTLQWDNIAAVELIELIAYKDLLESLSNP